MSVEFNIFQRIVLGLLCSVMLTACSKPAGEQARVATASDRADTDISETAVNFSIPFEKDTLDNGLEVILHQCSRHPISTRLS